MLLQVQMKYKSGQPTDKSTVVIKIGWGSPIVHVRHGYAGRKVCGLTLNDRTRCELENIFLFISNLFVLLEEAQ
jgi:hypothetical protein